MHTYRTQSVDTLLLIYSTPSYDKMNFILKTEAKRGENEKDREEESVTEQERRKQLLK